MLQIARTVVAYHGCAASFARNLLLGGAEAIASWKESRNHYDWLGKGIYFWEDGAARALRWAQEQAPKKDWGQPAVIGAVIRLGRCFDLLDEEYTALLKRTYEMVAADYRVSAKPLPENKGGEDRKRRDLDCLVINRSVELLSDLKLQTVRGAFLEGPEAYPGAMIREHTHIQVAVRDRRCILGVFAPNLPR
jgi:hypothetical protein